MAFTKGAPKPPGSGRKKGTPNKFTANLERICEEEGFDPFHAMIKMAKNKKSAFHFDAIKEVMKYLYPTRKAIEHSGNKDAPVELKVTAEQLEAAYKRAREKV